MCYDRYWHHTVHRPIRGNNILIKYEFKSHFDRNFKGKVDVMTVVSRKWTTFD